MDSNFAIIFSAVFISNIVLSQFLGICSFLGVSKSLRNALGMSAAVAFVMVLASLISWLVYYMFLAPYDLTYLKTIVFISGDRVFSAAGRNVHQENAAGTA